jgi:prephenate dehydrogenase
MHLFDKVAVVGVGLIGGSIALDIRKQKIAKEVIGISRHKSSLLIAKSLGAIDRGSQSINAVKDADLVILAAPVNTILNLALPVSKFIKPRVIVIDVGSTKEEIVNKLSKIFPRYVGAHPMAGSEKRGAKNAQAGIFKKSLCILTPVKNTDRVTLAKVKKLWKSLGAKVILLNPKAHDRILSFVSHLPHILAFSLINTVPEAYLKFASTSLRDTTRIAASDSLLWQDIFLSNKESLLRAVKLFQDNLACLKSAIEREDRRMLAKILTGAQAKRGILNDYCY